jgi:hypothetical protein
MGSKSLKKYTLEIIELFYEQSRGARGKEEKDFHYS